MITDFQNYPEKRTNIIQKLQGAEEFCLNEAFSIGCRNVRRLHYFFAVVDLST